jgi:hypothetical protein
MVSCKSLAGFDNIRNIIAYNSIMVRSYAQYST